MADAVIERLTGSVAMAVKIITLLDAGFPEAQLALEVMIHCTWSASEGE